MPPLWVQLWSFRDSRFYCLTCGDLKKKTEGRRDIKGEKEIVEQERRKERKKVLKERKNNKKINYLKRKKTAFCWLQTGKANFVGVFCCSQLRGRSPALLPSDHHSGSSGSALQRLLDTNVQTLTLLRAMGVQSGPSVMHTLLGACGLRSLQVALSLVHTPMGVPGGQVERRPEVFLQENSLKCPQVSFSS